jgi:hypothetical protein
MKICWSFFGLLRASPAMLSMLTLQKYFSHPSLLIYFLRNSTHDTQTEIANRWQTTNSKTSGSKTETSSLITFITLFSSKCTVLLHFTSLSKQTVERMQEQNYFPEPNGHVLTFVRPILMCMVMYIYSSPGDTP